MKSVIGIEINNSGDIVTVDLTFSDGTQEQFISGSVSTLDFHPWGKDDKWQVYVNGRQGKDISK